MKLNLKLSWFFFTVHKTLFFFLKKKIDENKEMTTWVQTNLHEVGLLMTTNKDFGCKSRVHNKIQNPNNLHHDNYHIYYHNTSPAHHTSATNKCFFTIHLLLTFFQN